MATLSQLQEQRENLDKSFKSVLHTDLESVIARKRQQLGQKYDFQPAYGTLEQLQTLCQELAGYRYKDLPNKPTADLHNFVRSVEDVFEKIKAFEPNDNEQTSQTESRHTGLINAALNTYNNHFHLILPYLNYFRTKEFDVEATKKEHGATLRSVKDAEEQVKQILTTVQDAAKETGVTQEATHFASQAKEHSDAATIWRNVSVGCGGAILMFAGILVWQYWKPPSVPLSASHAIRQTIANGIVFSILYFALVFAGRNFRSHRHNYVVNKHRQNALSTFQTFVEATEDEQIKNAVLMRATESIFLGVPTGYLSEEPKQSPIAPLNVVELVTQSAKNPQP